MLNYNQLAYFDDLLVECFIDRLYYWSKTRKVRDVHRHIRGVPKERIVEILKDRMVTPYSAGKKPDISGAVDQFMNIPSIHTFLLRYPSQAVKQEFQRHARRYLTTYSPECGFSIDVTDRYKVRSKVDESCVISRRNFKEGEEIKGLNGLLVHLAEDEEKELMEGRIRDFSIITSSRSGGICIMLGPARFVNHDCDANTKFVTLGGGSGMRLSLHAKRSISCGEQITVAYADNYFGKNNCECLCATCEKLARNGFDPSAKESRIAESESLETTKLDLSLDLGTDSVSDGSGRSTPLFSDPSSDQESSSTSLEPEVEVESSESQDAVRSRRLRNRKSNLDDLSVAHMFKALYASGLHKNNGQSELQVKEQSKEAVQSYFRRPFNHEGPERVTDCENCAVPVIHDYYDEEKLSLRSMERLLCPRCHRHAIIYNAFWPSTLSEEVPLVLYDLISKRIEDENRKDEEQLSLERNDAPLATKKRGNKQKRVILPAIVEVEQPKAPRRVSAWLTKRLQSEGIDIKKELQKATGPRGDEHAKQLLGTRKRRTSEPLQGDLKLETVKKQKLSPRNSLPAIPTESPSRQITDVPHRSPRIRKPSWKLSESLES